MTVFFIRKILSIEVVYCQVAPISHLLLYFQAVLSFQRSLFFILVK